MVQHFVITRVGIGIHQPSWFDGALSLFEAITFPSLVGQSSQDFTSLLIVDHQMPSQARERLERLVGGFSNFHIVPIDLTNMNSARQGCFDYVWDRCQDYLLARQIVLDPFEYVITSVLDGDDALHRDTVTIVKKVFEREFPNFIKAEAEGMTWIRHTGGMCLTFPDGLQWFAHPDVSVPMHYPFHSMSTFVAARFSSNISACSCRHSQWHHYCQVLNFHQLVEEVGRPMWVYTRHNRTEVGWDVQRVINDGKSAASLHTEFGIDFDKILEWRASQWEKERDRLSGGSAHKGMPGTEQLDCYFRITALNKQIVSLERELARGGLGGGVHALLARQRGARDQLLRSFHVRARENFQ